MATRPVRALPARRPRPVRGKAVEDRSKATEGTRASGPGRTSVPFHRRISAIGSAPRRTEETMEIQVLGPLCAAVNGDSIVPTAGKPRQVLALLALYPGRVVPVSTLMEEIWGTE